MVNKQSKLVEPSCLSQALSGMFGCERRTARVARVAHGRVAAGDVCLVQDGTFVLIKAPILLEGHEHIILVAYRCQRTKDITEAGARSQLFLAQRAQSILRAAQCARSLSAA